MQLSRKNGSTSNVIRAKLRDSSSSTAAGLTGLTSASSGLIISTITDNEATATTYTVAGSTIESITTLGTFAAPTATKVRFKEVDSTNHKGVYELHIADARFAVSGAKELRVTISGATNLLDTEILIDLASMTLITPGSSTGMLDVTSGVVKSSLVQILGTAITETAGQIAAAFTKFFNKASPTGTINSIPDAVAGATGGLFIAGTNAATTVTTSFTTTFTGNLTGTIGDTRLNHLDADITSRMASGATVNADVVYIAGSSASATRLNGWLADFYDTESGFMSVNIGAINLSGTAATNLAVTFANSVTIPDPPANWTQMQIDLSGYVSSNIYYNGSAVTPVTPQEINVDNDHNVMAVNSSGDAIPTLSQIDSQITTTHGDGSYIRNTEPDNASAVAAAASAAAAASGVTSLSTDVDTLLDRIPGSIAALVWSYGDRALNGSPVYTVPTIQFDNRTIIRGDTYGSQGQPFQVRASDGGTFPVNLDDYEWHATIKKKPGNTNAGTEDPIVCDVLVETATGDSRSLSVELPSADSVSLAIGMHSYDVEGVDGEKHWTVRLGQLDVLEDCSVEE